MTINLESYTRRLAKTVNQFLRPRLYRSDTLDEFTQRLMRRGEVLTQPDFDANIDSIGDDFAERTLTGRNRGIENLVGTVHKTNRAKLILEMPLGRVSNNDNWAGKDTTELRKWDNFYTGVLVSGYNLMFNVALSELYYAVDKFPEGSDRVSTKCREACKTIMRDAATYSKDDIKFHEEKKEFQDRGKRVVRQKPVSFKTAHEDSYDTFEESQTHTERSLLAIYRAFADQYKRFKDDTGILKASIIDPNNLEESIDTALLRLLGEEDHSGDPKPIRMNMRYKLTKKVLSAFSDTREGYEILEALVGKNLDLQSPDWIRRINPTKIESLALKYYNIRYGKSGQKISNFVFYHTLLTVALVGLAQYAAMKSPAAAEWLRDTKVVRDFYDLFTHPLYKVWAVLAITFSVDKVPAALLSRAYRRTQEIIYK